MKTIVNACIMAVILSFIATIAFAADYITDATVALEQTSVYVDPSLRRADRDISAQLQAVLNSNDNILLIMFPATAEQELEVDSFTIASRLSENLGNQKIIGLAVGNKVIGYAPALPAGVVTDLMRRANSVSNDPVTALITFAQNVHIWQEENPQATLPEPFQDEEFSWPGWAVFVSILSLTLGFVIRRRQKVSNESKGRIYFEAPNQIKDLLQKIASDRLEVTDEELQNTLYQLCIDIEKYFDSSSNNKKRDSLFFKERLTEVSQIVEKYIEVQQNQRYYYDPQEELKKGKESLTDFSHYVLDSIRRGNATDLLNYRVNTNILQAQRYR